MKFNSLLSYIWLSRFEIAQDVFAFSWQTMVALTKDGFTIALLSSFEKMPLTYASDTSSDCGWTAPFSKGLTQEPLNVKFSRALSKNFIESQLVLVLTEDNSDYAQFAEGTGIHFHV